MDYTEYCLHIYILPAKILDTPQYGHPLWPFLKKYLRSAIEDRLNRRILLNIHKNIKITPK